jgi:GT2 family glycosyltransferase
MYSFIVNSINQVKLSKLKANLERVMRMTSWELIHIPDATGMCEGYNRGMNLAKGEYLIFCHDDIEFAMDDASEALRHVFNFSDVFGVLGTRRAIGANFMRAGIPHLLGLWIQKDQAGLYELYISAIEGVLMYGAQSLDGLLIGCHRSVAFNLKWDEEAFPGWHGYDADFSYRAFRAGFNIAVSASIPLVHTTNGTFADEKFIHAEANFFKKYPETIQKDYPCGHLGSLRFAGYKSCGDVVKALSENFEYLIRRTGEVRAEFLGDMAKKHLI